MDEFDLLRESEDDNPVREFLGYKIVGKGGQEANRVL